MTAQSEDLSPPSIGYNYACVGARVVVAVKTWDTGEGLMGISGCASGSTTVQW